MVDGIGATKYSYDAADQLLTEDGPWDSDTVTYTYQNRLLASLALDQPSASPWSQSYGYDAARRLTNTTSPAGAFGYLYSAPVTDHASRITLPGGSYITNTFDPVARLLTTQLRNSAGSVLNSHAYTYNTAGQRTQQTRTRGDYVGYTYDNLGQLKTARAARAGRLHRPPPGAVRLCL